MNNANQNQQQQQQQQQPGGIRAPPMAAAWNNATARYTDMLVNRNEMLLYEIVEVRYHNTLLLIEAEAMWRAMATKDERIDLLLRNEKAKDKRIEQLCKENKAKDKRIAELITEESERMDERIGSWKV